MTEVCLRAVRLLSRRVTAAPVPLVRMNGKCRVPAPFRWDTAAITGALMEMRGRRRVRPLRLNANTAAGLVRNRIAVGPVRGNSCTRRRICAGWAIRGENPAALQRGGEAGRGGELAGQYRASPAAALGSAV